jgi:hypothetical protein
MRARYLATLDDSPVTIVARRKEAVDHETESGESIRFRCFSASREIGCATTGGHGPHGLFLQRNKI